MGVIAESNVGADFDAGERPAGASEQVELMCFLIFPN
jgi:hypothetical protein